MKVSSVEIVEVSARDGLQDEPVVLSTERKVELIERAVGAGVRRIEVASFVNPARVPQMADAEAVCQALGLPKGVVTIGLVLNRRGLERALATSVDEIGLVASASDSFGDVNQGRNSDQTVADAVELTERARAAGKRAQATISVAFGCPHDGKVEPGRVADIARRLAAVEPVEIALADTIGVAAPADVVEMMRVVREAVPGMPLRLHFHDAHCMAIANARAALNEGASTLDGSIGGIGGCPFAPGAGGNVATGSLLAMLEDEDVESGVRREEIAEISSWLLDLLGRDTPKRPTGRVPELDMGKED